MKLDEVKKSLQKQSPIEVYVMTKNISLPSETNKVFREAKIQVIDTDYLINNPHLGHYYMFAETSWRKELQMINLNIVRFTQLTKPYI